MQCAFCVCICRALLGKGANVIYWWIHCSLSTHTYTERIRQFKLHAPFVFILPPNSLFFMFLGFIFVWFQALLIPFPNSVDGLMMD